MCFIIYGACFCHPERKLILHPYLDDMRVQQGNSLFFLCHLQTRSGVTAVSEPHAAQFNCHPVYDRQLLRIEISLDLWIINSNYLLFSRMVLILQAGTYTVGRFHENSPSGVERIEIDVAGCPTGEYFWQ